MAAPPRRSPAATAVVALAVGATTPLWGYLGVLTAASLSPRRAIRQGDRTRRFAILVPAHDEAAVIGRALDAFKNLDYPADKVEMHVVADNCTDETASIVRAAGFTAHERTAPDRPGKGHALNWLFDVVDGVDDPPDAYVIVDADTSLEPGFLAAIDDTMTDGAQAVQGFYGVRDPERSTAAGIRYAALACRHHTRPLGRNRLGASCGLYGNGMAFDRQVLRGRRWTGHLVEDAEFQMELLLDGCPVVYAPGARLHAEMPDTLAASATQNRRWEQGRMMLLRRYAGPLLRRLGRRATTDRRATLDALADHLVPPLSIVVTAQVTTLGAALGVRVVDRGRLARSLPVVALVGTATIVGHVVVSLVAVGAPSSVYRALLGAPRAIWWKLGLWAGVARSDEVDWVRTERNPGHAVPDGPAPPPGGRPR